MGPLSVDVRGAGPTVVLVHGGLATAADEWTAQHPLAEAGFRLVMPDRRGYGRSPPATGEDFLADAADIVDLMGEGAHLVGHSYGGLGAMFAAARRPEATRSLALLEPAALALGQSHPAARALLAELEAIWEADLPDAAWLERFLTAVGSGPDVLPPELAAAALPLVPITRHGRAPWTADLSLDALKAAAYPKLVVSGGHSAAFDALCDDLAERIGAHRLVAAGAGHEVQFAADALNPALVALWRSAD